MHPILLALISAILIGAATPLAKPIVRELSVFQFAGLLYLGAALGVLPALFKTKPVAPWKLSGRNGLRLACVIVFGGILAPVCLLMGLQRASAASVSMWISLEPIFTTLIAAAFFQEHLGRNGRIGVVGCIAASILLSYGQGQATLEASLFVALSCLGWAIDNNFTALIDGLTPAEIVLWKGTTAAIVNLGIAAFVHQLNPGLMPISIALLLGIFCNGISLTFYITAAQALGSIRTQMIFASSPLWGVLLSMLLLGERLTGTQPLAAALFVVSIWIMLHDKHQHLHKHEALSHVHEHSHDDGHHNHTHEGGVPVKHSHWHEHEPLAHSHPHWPDLHHRHSHGGETEDHSH